MLGDRHHELVAELMPQGYDELLSVDRNELLCVVPHGATLDDTVTRALTAA